MGMMQLLDPTGETAWIRHAAGAARLIQVRGPQSYDSDFEKALFMAHTGPVVRSPPFPPLFSTPPTNPSTV